jgi:hypothetical protein
MHAAFAEGFADEMRKIAAPPDFNPMVMHDIPWVGEDLPAESWTKRHDFAYRQARKLVKNNPQRMAHMLHLARVEAMEEALARPTTVAGEFREYGAIDLSRPKLHDITPEMRRAMAAGERVRRRPELMSNVIRPSGPRTDGGLAELAIGQSRPMGPGEWLRSIVTRKRAAASAARALARR